MSTTSRALAILDDMVGAPEDRTRTALVRSAKARGVTAENANRALAWLRTHGLADKPGRPLGRGGQLGKAWQPTDAGARLQTDRLADRVANETARYYG